MDHDAARLHGVIREVYEKNKAQLSISPAWMATEGMNAIGFPRDLHEVGYSGCHLQFRQIARQFCRHYFDHTDDGNDLFPETLQERYPIFNGGGEEPEYVRREYLTRSQVAANVDRLRRSGWARLKHADALEAWDRSRSVVVSA